MAADVEVTQEAPSAPEASERGRYAVFETADGGWKIATAGPLCETCSGCGCGAAYRDPIAVPSFVVQMLTGGGMGGVPAPLRAMLGKVMGK
jgi:hypothetical protein